MSTNGTVLENRFNDAYKKYGLPERKIIDTTEAMVRVIGSPGIAMAEILALRIAKILFHAKVSPNNILYFINRDASIFSFQQPIEYLVGADFSHISIHTCYSFCEQVARENKDLFEKNSLLPVTTLEIVQLLKKLIAGFSKSHPIKRHRSDVYQEISNLKNLFSFMKREGWTSEKLIQKIDATLADLTTAVSSVNTLQIFPPEDKIEMLEKLRSVVGEYEHYQNLLQINNRYDGDDCIHLVLKCFEENKELLNRYRKKYTHLQVDNHDRNSNTLGKLIQFLTDENDQLNLLTVDYNPEAISLPENIEGKPNPEFTIMPHTHLLTINLDRQYKILPGQELINNWEINSYHSVNEEMAGITHQVYNLLQKGIAPQEMAIIYPDDEYCASLEQFLIEQKISFYSNRTINILTAPFVIKIIQLLRYISGEQDLPFSNDDLLFEILHYDFYKVPPIEIVKLVVEVNKKKYSKAPSTIRKILVEKSNAPAKDLFDTGINKNLQQVSDIIEKLIATVNTTGLVQIFEHTITHGLVGHYIDQSNDCYLLMQLLAALGDFIKNEAARNPLLQLNEFIAVIDTMEQVSIPIPAKQIRGSINDVQLIAAGDTTGKEFKYLFIAGANAEIPLQDDWIKLIKKLTGTNTKNITNNFAERQHSALLQLWHTSLTQDTTHIFASFAKFDKKGVAQVPTDFLTDILCNPSIPVNDIMNSVDELSTLAVLQKTKLQPEIAQPDPIFITPILKKFVMNVSALNSYLNCPLGFYYKNILRIPTKKNEAMEFGSAIHHALENLFKKMSSGYLTTAAAPGPVARQYAFPSPVEMVEDFRAYLYIHRANFTDEAFERRLYYGGEVLSNYYHQYIKTWNKVVSVERNISGITVQGVPLKGKLDKLEFNGKEVTIVDYKSGNIEKARPKMKPPHEGDPNGGDYWRQAVFYKILVDHYEQKDWKVTGVEFDFIEPDKKKAYRKEKILIAPPDIETVKQQIADVWAKIQAHQFYTGCGKQDCYWCNFVKDNKLAVALHAAE